MSPRPCFLFLILVVGCSSGSGGQDAGLDGDDGGNGGDYNNPDRITYYINIQDPQADNEACNGLYPQTQPGGPPDCPFKDFTSQRTLRWEWVENITIIVMPGSYYVEQQCAWDQCDCMTASHWDLAGIMIITPENNTFEKTVVFKGDNSAGEVILAGGNCTGHCCDYPRWPDDTYDGHPAHLLDVYGAHVEVSGFKFEGAAYHNVAWGPHHSRFYDNVLMAPMSDDGDSLKGVGAHDVRVHDNVFDGFNDQAIDIAGNNYNWIVENNTFRNGNNAALAGKCGTRDITFRNNTITDIENIRPDGAFMGAVGIGGACQIANADLIKERCGDPPQAPCYSIENWQVHGNTISNLSGWTGNDNAMGGAAFYSCEGCQFYDNTITNADFGVFTSDIPYGDPDNPDDIGEHPVIQPSVGISFRNNDYKDIGVALYVFLADSFSSPGDITGNRHCIDPLTHPDCGTSNDPGDARDTAYHHALTSACAGSTTQGLVTLNELEGEVGDLGDHHWAADCPF